MLRVNAPSGVVVSNRLPASDIRLNDRGGELLTNLLPRHGNSGLVNYPPYSRGAPAIFAGPVMLSNNATGPAWSGASENLPNPDVHSGVPGNFNNPGVNCAAQQALTYRNNCYSCVATSGDNTCIKCTARTLGRGGSVQVSCADGRSFMGLTGNIAPALPAGYCY